MNNHKKIVLKIIIFLIPIILFFWIMYLKYENVELLDRIASEDALFEIIQFWLFFLGGILMIGYSLFIRKKVKQKIFVLSLLLGIFLLIWAMEEISWGQRIWDWESLGFFQEYNYQGETTVHNMEIVTHVMHPFFLFVGFSGSILCALRTRLIKQKYFKLIYQILPFDYQYFTYFFVLFIIYFLYEYIRGLNLSWWIDSLTVKELETAEMLVAGVLFLMISEKVIKQSWKKVAVKQR